MGKNLQTFSRSTCSITLIICPLISIRESVQGQTSLGILGAKSILNALNENGQAETAYKLAAQDTFPSWKRSGKSVIYRVTTPPNFLASISFPLYGKKSVSGGKDAAGNDDYHIRERRVRNQIRSYAL